MNRLPKGFLPLVQVPSRTTPDPAPPAKQAPVSISTNPEAPALKRVAIVSPTLQMGGAENMARTLARGLEAIGHQVELVDASQQTPDLDQVEATIWWGQVFTEKPPGSIYVIHSPGGNVPAELEASKDLIDHAVAVCQQGVELAQSMGLEATRIWNGVEAPSQPPQRPVRHTPTDPFVIGYVGRYAAGKGLDRVIKALPLLPENVRFRTFGEGITKDSLLELARRHHVDHRLDLGGRVEDVYRPLADFDCLIIASDYEGMPLAAAEAAQAGVPIVHCGQGDLPVLFKEATGTGIQVRPDPHSIAGGIMRLVEDPELAKELGQHTHTRHHTSAHRMAEQYARLIRKLRPDMTREITAFVITSGEPSTRECISRLERQTVRVKVDVIENVSPMWAAFDQMHKRVQTPFFVQVDADMMLEPDAIETLYNGITEAGPKCGQFVGWLWGDAERTALTGCKIYRTEIATRYPYTESLSCEWPHFKAMEADGFKMEIPYPMPTTRAGCIGLHYSLQSEAMAFDRWKRLMGKWRKAPDLMGWFTRFPRSLWEQAKENPKARAAVAGAIVGLSGPLPEDKESDASQRDYSPDRISWLLSDYSKGPTELSLYLTARCNHRCTWCRNQQVGTYKAPDLKPAQVERALKTYPTINSVCLAGFGEPLLHPDMDGIFGAIGQGIFTDITTNGSLLLERIEDIKKWSPSIVSVSLNAPNAEAHKATTRATTWQTILDGIEAVQEAGIPVRLTSVMTTRNVGQLPEFIALANSLEAQILFFNLLPHGDIDDAGFLRKVISTKSTRALAAIASAKQLPEAKGIVARWPVVLDLDATSQTCPKLCPSPFHFMGIDGTGKVTGCSRIEPPGERWGHLHETSWVREPYNRLRGAMWGDGDLPAQCLRCWGAWGWK